MSGAAIAKLVRADLKAAQKKGTLPHDLKWSVRIDRYSMGEEILVVLRMPKVLMEDSYVWNGNFLDYDREAGRTSSRFTKKADVTYACVEAILNAYNFNKSDTASDYHNYRFADRVEWDAREELEDLAAVRKAECALARLDKERAQERAQARATQGCIAATGWDD